MSAHVPPPAVVWQRVVDSLSQDPQNGFNTFQEACGRWARDRSKLAVVVRHPQGTSERWTYADLSLAAARMSRVFTNAGLKPGDRVAGVLSRQIEAWICALGAWRAGLVYVPLFCGFGGDALAFRLRASGSRAVVVGHQWRESLLDAATTLGTELDVITVAGPRGTGIRQGDGSFWAEMERAAPDGPELTTVASDPATLMFTSGTTSEPKACVIPHSGVIALLPFVQNVFGVDEGDLLFATSDPGWSYGLYTSGCAVMALGIPRLIYTGDFDTRTWLRVMSEERATFAVGAPTAFRQVLMTAQRLGFPESLRGASTAGEPLDADTVRAWQDASGTPIRDGYGLTEMGMVLADLANPQVPGEPGSLDSVVPGFEVDLVDRDGKPVDGDEGIIAIRRPPFQLSSGYENAPKAWANRWRDGRFLTDDLARRDKEGRWFFAGRADDVIVTSGYNVGPVEVEAIILENPHIVEAAVVAAPDPRRGSIVRAVAVRAHGAPPTDVLASQLQEAVRQRLGRHAYPRVVDFVDALPRTATGKVRRATLRETTARIS